MNIINYNNYLTKQNLNDYLVEIYHKEWLHDKCFITRSRPDYRNDELKLIVEFDGPQHYTSAKRIIADYKRDRMYLDNGYKTIRIPYFILLSKEAIKLLFDIDTETNLLYPHGFISDANTLVLPADFCELGIKRFKEDLLIFSKLTPKIIESLKIKVLKLQDQKLVMPPSLLYLLN